MLRNLAVMALALSFVAFSQNVKVPKDVTNAFAKLYPKATSVKWDKEGESEFEASFKENGKNVTVTFEANGKVKETESSITEKELPKGVKTYITKHYSGYKVTEAAMITDAKGTVTYEAEITKAKSKHDLMFDKSGNFLKMKDKEKEAKG